MGRHTYRLGRGGPSPHARLPVETKRAQGFEAWQRHFVAGVPIRQVAAQLGVSRMTAWRRAWWYADAVVYPEFRGEPRDHVPPQRSTRECPSGEPPLLVRPAGARRIRHPLPAVRCRAHRSRDGGRCRRWATRGAAVCRSHGAGAPAVRAKAAERVRVAVEADRLLRERLGGPEMRVADLRAQVLSERRPWMP